MGRNLKSAAISAAELKRQIPDVAVVARDLYGIDFKNGVAQCSFPQNHSHGDRDPSLRFDKRKNRLFCASQNCLGAKGVDAIGLVQSMDRCSFPEAIQKLADHYGIRKGGDSQDLPRHDVTPRGGTPEESRQGEQRIPADSVRQGLSRRGFRAVAEFEYGANLRKVRFEHQSSRQVDKDRAEKEFRWEHLHDGIWLSGDGGLPRPLYVNRAFRERDQVGLVVGFEGEAKADLAGELGFAAFSFKNITVEQAATLADCDVVLWRDNDASGEGQANGAAQVIFDAAQTRSIKLLTPPSEFPIAADIIDAVNELNWDRTRIVQFLETGVPFGNGDGHRKENNTDGFARASHEKIAEAGSLTTRCLSDIEAKPVSWLWQGRIARGKLTIIAGNPGLGKSQITASIAAVVTTGGRFPVDRYQCKAGDVLFLSAEDDPADTLRPRLEAAGADLRRIHVIEGVIAGYAGDGSRTDRTFSLQADIQALGLKLAELGEVAAVVIDPISAYLGDTDSHKNADVRGLLAPLSALAARHDVAIIAVSHLTKGATAQVLMRVTGSLAFVAAARAAYLVTVDPRDKARRLFLPMKNNLGPDATGLAFRIESATVASSGGPLETSRVLWDSEAVPVTADEAMAMQSDRGGGSISALGIAKDWLSETLASGPMPADEVFDRAKADKIATKTLQRASRALGIQKVKLGMADGWSWSLPPKMAKSAEDAQVSDVATFEEVGHLREIGGSKAPQGPSNRIDLCAQCGRNEWRRDGAAWVCAGCEIPARKSERVGEGVSEVDCAPQDEQPMSPVEPTE